MFPVIGYGNLILDIYYMNGVYIGCDGGGTVFNILTNLSSLGFETYALTTNNIDNASSICIQSLENMGVTSLNHFSKKGSGTKRLHLNIPPQVDPTNVDFGFTFTKKCIFCHNVSWPSYSIPLTLPAGFENTERAFVLFDLVMSPSKIKIAQIAKEKGWYTCADIGHIGPLLYLTTSQIVHSFSNIDILQLNNNVAKSLLSKFEVVDFSSIFQKLSSKVVIVTDGSKRVIFYYRDSCGNINEYHQKPELVDNIMDVSGAGDAFLSGFLAEYARYTEKYLTSNFFEKAFLSGNSISKKAIQAIGARGHIVGNTLTKVDFSMDDVTKCKYCGL